MPAELGDWKEVPGAFSYNDVAPTSDLVWHEDSALPSDGRIESPLVLRPRPVFGRQHNAAVGNATRYGESGL